MSCVYVYRKCLNLFIIFLKDEIYVSVNLSNKCAQIYINNKIKSFIMLIVSCLIIEPRHEISNNVVCATSKASDQPVHMRSLIRGFASRLNIL